MYCPLEITTDGVKVVGLWGGRSLVRSRVFYILKALEVVLF